MVMVPYFLSAGMHVTQDLEDARQALAAKYPHIHFHLCEPLGRHPLMVEIVLERAGQQEGPMSND